MCTKCGYTTVNTNNAAYETQKIQNATTTGNIDAAFIGNLMTGHCNSSGNNTQTPTTNTHSTAPQDSRTVEDPKEQEEKVKTLLGETTFNALSDEVKEEVLKKYSTIKEFSAYNNINVTDAEMTRRLSNYINALKSHAQEIKMGEYFINGGLANEYTGESIVDENVRQQKATGSDEEYFQALLDRGKGIS